jgi:TBC1 domain family protein 5
LILTRELRFDDAMQLWDGMFADHPKLGLLEYVCVAMLLRIRNECTWCALSHSVLTPFPVLNADYPTILTNLLRYPGHSTDYPLSPSLLLSQAKLLRSNVSPTTGVQVVLQNHEALGIKPAPEEVEREATRPRQSLNGRGRGRGPPAFAGRTPPGVQGLAQGLIERAQAAGKHYL